MERKQTVAQAIASAFTARQNCQRDLDDGRCHESFIPLREEWLERWTRRIESLCENCLPSGSGFDSGVTLDMEASKPDRLVFIAEYHPMNGHGYYESWVSARVTVRPAFEGLDVTARGAGSEHNDYIADCMAEALRREAPALVVAESGR